MRFLSRILTFSSLLLPISLAAQVQQTTPAAPAPGVALSEDSVRVMSGLVQASVRQLRAIYYEADDARATQLVETALLQIPAYNQRLSTYTASLPREQQQLLAQRLRQQPWQIELQTLLRSPQYKDFNTRTARSPGLKAAADRLAATGFLGTRPAGAKPTAGSVAKAPATTTPEKAMVAASAPKALAITGKPASATAPATMPGNSLAAAPARPLAAPITLAKPAPAKPDASKGVRHHTVTKGETLFAIARQYGVKPAQLQSWNDKPDNSVKIGEVLTIQTPE
ncbi:LysM peptidoglycan-binding domain-containing protein [Hymenobacter canadensis]|uniref:LysM peptidoglycan-binding domain-containing protein n=1 Tax=Hymenobacter canadensis TaxID=2999067 RepID=A0ABY7LN72_9BACT|nr:LysM peptidoglycan-binding domain-containing protein [Hymenobacter canadensis]WBA40343.1 LysM peptidoglycan-binding domain-containing protein [Hymenobacter canadensis]